jgi:hypothetical protein
MNWAMPSGIRSKIATAAVMGALAAIPALSAPAHAFAAPAPSHAPVDSAIDANKFAYQTNDTSIPTSIDGLRYAQLPLPVDYRGGSDNDNDNDDMYYDYY